MKRILLLVLWSLPLLMFSQDVYDYESAQTSINFQIFGGNLEGAQTTVIANPDQSGLNTSAMVLEAKKASDAPEWGGMFANPAPAEGIDATDGGTVCVDVWMGSAGSIRLKLEMADNADPANYEMDAAVATGGEWVNVCFDLSANSVGGDMTPAAGKTFVGLVFFPNFGVPGDGTETTFYLDNITLPESGGNGGDPIECLSLYDFETTTMDSYQTFGGGADSIHLSADFIIPNPGMDALNSSANVMEYTKIAGSASWAGMFWNLVESLDANFAYEVCIDIWSPEPIDVLLKLENGDASQNWETAQSTTQSGAWETLCYDLNTPSVGGDNSDPAIGKIFNTMVLFPQFGVDMPAEDFTVFIDNFLVKSDNTVTNYDVTFSVDMNSYTGTFTTVYVSGAFNDWSDVANPLSDDDGDGIWSGVVSVPGGQTEYKFQVDGWSDQESLSQYGDCVAVFDDGNEIFVNRRAIISSSSELGPFCWSQCYACGESYSITWNIDFSNTTVGEGGPFVAGGCCFGNSVFALTDDDGDGIYSLTVRRQPGFSSHYTFLSDACADWSCKENIEGQDCADPNNFNDRFLPELTGDVVINSCYGQCIDGACVTVPTSVVTFRVDLSDEDVSADGVFILGQFTSWQDEPMTDEGEGVYSYTSELAEGDYEYLYKNGNDIEAFDGTEGCTLSTDDGQGNIFINRFLSVDGLSATTDLDLVCFNACSICVTNVNDLTIDDDLFTVSPSVSSEAFNLTLNTDEAAMLSIVTLNGQLITRSQIESNVVTIDATQLSAGVYLLNVVSGNAISTQRIVVTR